MLSVLSGALLMVASSLIGIAIKRIFRVRYAYFSDAVDFLNLYKREISSLQTPLEDVIKTFVSSSKGAFSDSLQKFADGLPAGFKNVEEVQKKIVTIVEKFHKFQRVQFNEVSCNCCVHSGRNTIGLFYMCQ